jgi:hypothetical protein
MYFPCYHNDVSILSKYRQITVIKFSVEIHRLWDLTSSSATLNLQQKRLRFSRF